MAGINSHEQETGKKAPRKERATAAPSSKNTFKQGLVELMPNLRAFARSLTQNAATADDLVQDTLVKAIANQHRFEPGTNLRAWLFTILRNHFYSQLRKRKREIEDVDGKIAANISVPGAQEASIDLEDFKTAFRELAPDHREVLTLVGALGTSYAEAAEVMGCAVGTIKSRVNRARRTLGGMLDIHEDESGIEEGTEAAGIPESL